MNISLNLISNNSNLSHCSKDALTDMFGWFLQGLLFCLAFTCLIVKRFCEPKYSRRPWLIWFYDTSKQGVGACAIHFANIWLSGQFQGDPCTWYIINFLLDSSVGLFFIYIGIRTSQYLALTKQWKAFNFGEYGKPPSTNIWLIQCCLYVVIMVIVKTIITLLIQFKFWETIRDFIISPITNPTLEITFVMVIIPFFVNILMFWVTDNFLMKKHKKNYITSMDSDDVFVQRTKVRYKVVNKDDLNEPDTNVLLSDDDELLDDKETIHSTTLPT